MNFIFILFLKNYLNSKTRSETFFFLPLILLLELVFRTYKALVCQLQV